MLTLSQDRLKPTVYSLELPTGMPDPKEEHDVIVKLKTFR